MTPMDPNNTNDQATGLPPELAELEAVAAAADARTAAADPQALAQVQAQQLADQAAADQAGRVAAMAEDLAVFLVPVTEGIRQSKPWTQRQLTEDWTRRHCTLAAAVFVKRGWDVDKLLSPELLLGGSLLWTGYQLSQDAKAYAAWQAQQQQAQQGQGAAS
jgi:hypothetical protein